MRRFVGKTAVITGGASGIGAACASRFAAEGAAVVVADVADGDGQEQVAQINSDGGRAHYCHTDVSDPDAWTRLAKVTHDAFGPVDIVHSNAYTIIPGSADTLRFEAWNQQIAVNLTSLYLAAHTFIEDLKSRNGSLIASSSVHAMFGLPGHPAYAASKGGICALVRQLAAEYGRYVRVNAVLPGPIRTAVWDSVDQSALRTAAKATAIGRLGTPDEVAGAVTFLASPDASFITGASLVIDGGWSITKESP